MNIRIFNIDKRGKFIFINTQSFHKFARQEQNFFEKGKLKRQFINKRTKMGGKRQLSQ